MNLNFITKQIFLILNIKMVIWAHKECLDNLYTGVIKDLITL